MKTKSPISQWPPSVADVAKITLMPTWQCARHGCNSEVAALADAGDTRRGDRAGVHGDGFADGAAGSDIEPGQFVAIAQRLRRGAQRDER